MASFESVNYSLRPNKNIERKLIFEALRALDPAFPLATYRYIGLGSMWFTDFVLAHKTLGIADLTSIERDVTHAARADFNRPFGCVKVVPGDTSRVLPTRQIDLGRAPAVVWLDYDTDLSGPAMDDIAMVCEKVPGRSIVLVTVNAHKGQLAGVRDPQGNERSLLDALGFLTKSRVALDFDPKEDFTLRSFPKTAARVLLDHLERTTRKSGRDERFVPLLNFTYSDGAPMVTVGGMIVDDSDRARLGGLKMREQFDFVRGEEQVAVEAPLLTVKEKQALDQMLPRDDAPSEAEVVEQARFPLKAAHIAAYHRYYKQYPIFSEFQP